MERTDLELLVNEPVTLKVGGATNPDTVKEIELREPASARLGKHVSILQAALTSFVINNAEFLRRAWDDPGSITRDDILQIAEIAEVGELVIADLVGEDASYVQNEMTARQIAAVIGVYLDLIGWDFIRETFDRALRNWKAAAAKVTKPTPPWSVGPSSPSPGTSEKTPSGSGTH